MKRLLIPISLIVLVLFLAAACTPSAAAGKEAAETSKPAFAKAETQTDESGTEPQADFGLTPYTIMIYMNGSDLETEGGMGSADIGEMAGSGFDPAAMNIVLFTGGTAQWADYNIPNDTNSIFSLTGDGLKYLADSGAASIGEADTLTQFIDYAYGNFPAQNYGLILWNHGAGAVEGYGCDELYDYDSLTLDELYLALSKSRAANQKLEFIGFDACLMATVETAWATQGFANYLVASEELEPGCGWDYSSLAAISKSPGMTGDRIGKILADDFVSFYEQNQPEEQATLSVIDLSKVNAAVEKLSAFSKAAEKLLNNGEYTLLAKSRGSTKAFGSMGAHGGETDMIDIVHMSEQMQALFPAEAGELSAAVDDAVVYAQNTKNIENANGLSVYFPFADKASTPDRVSVYENIPFSADYTQFVGNFAQTLTGENFAQIDVADTTPIETDMGDYQITLTPEELRNIYEIYFTVWAPSGEGNYYIQMGESSNVAIDENGVITTEFDGNWTALNGYWVCMYELSAAGASVQYSIPAYLNGTDVDLIVVYDKKNPDGKIIGAIPVMDEKTGMPAKNMIDIKDGDKITLLYYAELFSDETGYTEESQEPFIWFKGDEFTVEGGLTLADYEVEAGSYLYGFYIVDYQQNGYYTDFVEVTFD